MLLKQPFTIILVCLFITNCGNSETVVPPSAEEIKMEILHTGEEDIKQLLSFINSDKIIINQTSSSELAALYNIEENEYYMTKKITFEDHTLYINFTISQGILTKINYATLSNSPKEFSYIDSLLSKSFGNDYILKYNTNDSTANNTTKTWNLNNTTIQYVTFSELNSGYELTIKESHPNK